MLKSKIDMVNTLLNKLKVRNNKTEANKDNEKLSRLAREQFKKLLERGTDLPVALL